MYKVSNKEDETIKIIFSQGFNPDEIEEITESFSKIMPVEKRHFATDSVSIDGVVKAVLIIVLIGQGFFKEIGSDLYRTVKEKVIRIFKTKQNPTLIFQMSYKGTKILVECQTNDERELSEVFDTIDKARDIAIRKLDKKETPEMRIYYDNGWILDSEENL